MVADDTRLFEARGGVSPPIVSSKRRHRETEKEGVERQTGRHSRLVSTQRWL